MRRRQTWTAVALLLLVALVVGGCATNQLVARDQEPTPTPTKTPKPTFTAAAGPTSTPIPTQTPLPTATPTATPTNTPEPTATPVPSATPSPSPVPASPTSAPRAAQVVVTATPLTILQATAQPSAVATVTPEPTATPPPPTATPGRPFTGRFVDGLVNCSLTQVIGVVVDGAGNPVPGVAIRLWWHDGETYHTTAGSYVRPETNAAGWEFFLNHGNVANTWFVAVEDGPNGELLSDPVAVATSGSCEGGAVNVARVQFVKE